MSRIKLRAFILLFTMIRASLMLQGLNEDSKFIVTCDKQMNEIVKDYEAKVVK